MLLQSLASLLTASSLGRFDRKVGCAKKPKNQLHTSLKSENPRFAVAPDFASNRPKELAVTREARLGDHKLVFCFSKIWNLCKPLSNYYLKIQMTGIIYKILIVGTNSMSQWQDIIKNWLIKKKFKIIEYLLFYLFFLQLSFMLTATLPRTPDLLAKNIIDLTRPDPGRTLDHNDFAWKILKFG